MKYFAFFVSLLFFGGCARLMGIEDTETVLPKTSPPSIPTIASIQLFANAVQTQPPIIRINSDETLDLHFDVMSFEARPLSIYFFHEDVTGKRLLQPIEYMKLARQDDLLTYWPSSHTQQPYSHYHYRFPNHKIQFRISGRYVLAVTEQGNPTQVFFERTFFIHENQTNITTNGKLILGDQVGRYYFWPETTLELPESIAANIHQLTVCGYENDLGQPTVCDRDPRLSLFPRLTYGPLRQDAYQVMWDRRVLDLRTLQNGGKVEQINRSLNPFGVKLIAEDEEQDLYSAEHRTYGYPKIGSSEVPQDAENLQAEYVDVTFRFVPTSKTALPFPVYLQGDFNQWKNNPTHKMAWSAEENAYKVTLMLKQGLYEYRYFLDNPNPTRRNLATWFNRSIRWQTLVFYRDTFLGTDRLIGTEVRIWD